MKWEGGAVVDVVVGGGGGGGGSVRCNLDWIEQCVVGRE